MAFGQQIRIAATISSLCIRQIEAASSGETIGITAEVFWRAHRVRVPAMLNDAVYHPNLQSVVEAVQYTAVSDFIFTQPRHSLSILCNRSPRI